MITCALHLTKQMVSNRSYQETASTRLVLHLAATELLVGYIKKSYSIPGQEKVVLVAEHQIQGVFKAPPTAADKLRTSLHANQEHQLLHL